MSDEQAEKDHDKKIFNRQLQKTFMEIEVLEQFVGNALRDMKNARKRLAEIFDKLNQLEDAHD